MSDASSSADAGTDESTKTGLRAIDALGETTTLSVPASASRSEAAAIAAAVGAHLRDRATVVAESRRDDPPTECDPWKLCGRLRARSPPRTVVRGEEWKAAGRTRR